MPIMASHDMQWEKASFTLPSSFWYHQCAVHVRSGLAAVTKSYTVLRAAESALFESLHLTT